MRTYQLQDFANPISVAVTNPSQSGYSRFVGLEHYDSGELVVKRYSGTELLTTTAKAFETNDILIARRNVYLKRAGIVFFDGITSGDTIVLRIKNDCESATGVPKDLAQRIIPIVLNSEHFWIYANKHADGMNSKRISKEMLLTYEFELPSLEEQRVLADKLWASYEVKESYKNLLAQTDKLLHAQFEKMFGNAETNGTIASLVYDNIRSVKKTYKPEDTISYIDISSVDAELNEVIATTDYLVSKAPSRAQQCVQEGDILVSTTRPINKNIAVIKSKAKNLVASTGFCVLRPKEEYRAYLLAIVKSDMYTKAMCDKATGGVYPAVNNSDVLSYKIVVPSPEVLQEVTSLAEQSEKTKASLNKGIEAIEAVIRSLIAEGTTKV